MNYSFLRTTRLFQGISEENIKIMIECLSATMTKYQKGDLVYHAGETIDAIGMVLSGGVNIEHNDYWGNKIIISHVSPGLIFGETYACIPGQPLMVDVVTTGETEILYLRVDNVMKSCPQSCLHHSALIHNLLTISAHKNLLLSQRMFHTSFKSLRTKLLSYLSEQERLNGSNCFTIPFNRQQLANYLNVDRSAMCNEISKMKKDGIISVSKNTFTLYEDLGEKTLF